jgi:hypothetical protein
MKFANLQCEWARVIRGLEALQQVEATFPDKCPAYQRHNLSDENLVLARLLRYASKGLFSIAPKERYLVNQVSLRSLEQ